MDTRRPPRVSICMPVYNGAAYIAESLESVLTQTYTDFRLIVCDNCSTDNTEEIVRSFQDPRLTYSRNSRNLGPVGNANRCLELADGEFVCIFHHDDIMLPDNIERKVHILDKHRDIGFVHSNLMRIDPNGKVIASDIWCQDSRRDYIEDGYGAFIRFLNYLPWGSSIFIGAVLARSACYGRLGGFRSELVHCNDSEMWMKMLLFYDVACIGTPLVKYRIHPLSASSEFGDHISPNYLREHHAAVKIIFEDYKNRLSNIKSLRKHVFTSFGKRSLTLARGACRKGQTDRAREFLIEAMRMYPGIWQSPAYWRTMVRTALGSAKIL